MELAWSKGKLSVVDECVAIGCRLHDAAFPSIAAGAGILKEHIASCRKGFPDLRFTLDDVIAERDEVVIHWTGSGTHRGEFLGMPPTNRAAKVSGASIFRIHEGKVIEYWSDWNLLTLLQQLGVSAAPRVESQDS